MRKKINIVLIVLLISTIFFLSGCWDNRELDTLSIVTGIGIDATSDVDIQKYVLQIQKAQPKSGTGRKESKGGSGGGGGNDSSSTAFLLTNENPGLISAISDLRKSSTRDIYLYHNQVLIFGRDRAQESLLPELDAFTREHEMRMEIFVMMADETAEKVLSTSLPQETNAAIGLARMMRDEKIYTKTLTINLLDFITKVHDKTTAPVLPIIAIRQTDTEDYFEITGLAVFDKDCKLAGDMDLDLARGYSWGHGHYTKAFLNVTSEYGSFTVAIDDIRTSDKAVFSSSGIPGLDLKIKGNFSISEIKGFKDMTPEEIAPIIERQTNEAVVEKIQKTLRYSQSINCDIFGIGIKSYRSSPKKWPSLEPRWNEIYPQTFINTTTELKLISTGKAFYSLEMKDPHE